MDSYVCQTVERSRWIPRIRSGLETRNWKALLQKTLHVAEFLRMGDKMRGKGIVIGKKTKVGDCISSQIIRFDSTLFSAEEKSREIANCMWAFRND